MCRNEECTGIRCGTNQQAYLMQRHYGGIEHCCKKHLSGKLLFSLVFGRENWFDRRIPEQPGRQIMSDWASISPAER
jgi:hypothetical protein